MPYDQPAGSITHKAERQESPANADGPPERRAADDKDESPGDDNAQPHRRSPWLWPLVAAGVLLAALAVAWYWYANKDLETTDDAYTDGRAITVASQISGQVLDLAVTDNQFVHTGDVLIRVDPRLPTASRAQAEGQKTAAQGQLDAARAVLETAHVTYPAKLLAAQAQRDAAKALLSRTQADLRRQQAVSRAATTQQDIDQATAGERQAAAQLGEAEANVKQAEPVEQNIAQAAAQVKQLEGQVAQADAQLAQADINLGYATVTAPQDGWVTKRNVERGNYVSAGAAILSLVSPEVWVTANFKENQLNRIRPGQAVRIAVDAYPGLKLRGHVDSLQLGSGARFTAFPPENATGNFVKIVQRLPLKIVIDSGLDPKLPLPLGLSVGPTVELK